MGNNIPVGIAYADPDLQAVTCTTLAASGAVTLASTVAITGVVTPTGGVAAGGGFTANPRVIHTGAQPPMVSTDGTNATPVATETYISQVFVPANMTITGISIFNGATVGTDKGCVFLADSAGNVVAQSAAAGATTSGADSYQDYAFTSAYSAKGPATYYVCYQMNGTTDRYNAHTFGRFGASKKTGTTFGALTSITAPTTFTTALGPMATLY